MATSNPKLRNALLLLFSLPFSLPLMCHADDDTHWSFRPLAKVRPDVVSEDDWSRNGIDRFTLKRMRENGLSPSSPTAPETLLRRVFFDLTGLPPTPGDVTDYLAADRETRYAELVERLLASPRYGERWAQPWLDLARFAETDGFEHDKVRPTAWKYRDWVVRALNSDIGFDEFTRLQLAGDVLYPDDPDSQTATAFCLSGPDMPDVNSQVERKHTLLNEMTGTVGEVFLALQLGCAQCHDHMYDPISQADFYRFRAFFEPAVHVKRDVPVSTLADAKEASATSHILERGDWRRQGEIVKASFPEAVNVAGTGLRSDRSDLRRAELAEWLVDGDAQALVARVIVNRIWQQHFEKGLAANASDFGVMGAEPTHPELLDWLAAELIRSGWQLKSLHRQIVLSSTYRQSSLTPDSRLRCRELDPENQWLSHFPRRRLQGEMVRDAMLSVSDSLNAEMGGPGVRPPLPPEMKQTLLRRQWDVTPDSHQHLRRSVYVFARRNLRYPLFAAFDRPAANKSCARRQTSVTAPQSLWLLNSTEAMEAARRLARSILLSADETQSEALIRESVLRVYGRHAGAEEVRLLGEFWHSQSGSNSDVLEKLCLALMNTNEFLFID